MEFRLSTDGTRLLRVQTTLDYPPLRLSATLFFFHSAVNNIGTNFHNSIAPKSPPRSIIRPQPSIIRHHFFSLWWRINGSCCTASLDVVTSLLAWQYLLDSTWFYLFLQLPTTDDCTHEILRNIYIHLLLDEIALRINCYVSEGTYLLNMIIR